MAKITTRIISLSLPSDLDDLHCKDGEVEHGELIFPTPEDTTVSSGNSGNQDNSQTSDNKKNPEYRIDPTLDTTPVGQIPAESKLLLIHRPTLSSSIFIFVQLKDGRLAYIRNNPGTIRILSEMAFDTIINTSSLNDFVIFHTLSSTVYALYNRKSDSGYTFLNKAPAPPKVLFRHIPCAIPPYSPSEESYPSFSIETSVPEDQAESAIDWLAGRQNTTLDTPVKNNLKQNIASAFSTLLTAIEKAGLYLSPVMAAASLESREGSLFRPTPPVILSSDEKMRLNISSVSYSAGVMYIRLTLTRRPFKIAVSADSNYFSEVMRDIFPRLSFFSLSGI